MRSQRRMLLIAAAILLFAPAQRAAEPEESQDAAVTALTSSLAVEQTLLEEDRTRYLDAASRRRAALARLQQLHEALDAAVQRDDPAAGEQIERLTSQLEQAEGQRTELRISERVLLDRILDRLRRVQLFEEQLARLRDREPPEAGLLTGTWDVVLLPHDQRGTFQLNQTGTIVTGTYRLSGGFSGSLQGTLVQNKLFLQRIDAQLGRSMELEGRLASDTNRIRGTWLSYELAEGQGASGQWSATRRAADAPPTD